MAQQAVLEPQPGARLPILVTSLAPSYDQAGRCAGSDIGTPTDADPEGRINYYFCRAFPDLVSRTDGAVIAAFNPIVRIRRQRLHQQRSRASRLLLSRCRPLAVRRRTQFLPCAWAA